MNSYQIIMATRRLLLAARIKSHRSIAPRHFAGCSSIPNSPTSSLEWRNNASQSSSALTAAQRLAKTGSCDRAMSTSTPATANVPIACYDEVKNDPRSKGVFLIDVREPKELQETGVLPQSVNIPLDQVGSALDACMSSDDFLQRYGREKPSLDTPIIFSCRSGARSAKATAQAISMGYKKSKSYGGGWMEWEKKMQEAN